MSFYMIKIIFRVIEQNIALVFAELSKNALENNNIEIKTFLTL